MPYNIYTRDLLFPLRDREHPTWREWRRQWFEVETYDQALKDISYDNRYGTHVYRIVKV